MKTSFMFVAAALSFSSVGCKKQTAAGNDCAKAIGNSLALSKAEMAKTPGVDARMLQKMADLGVQRCKEDKWSGDAIKCMTDAKSMDHAQGCYGTLSQDQQDKMNKAAMEMAMGSQDAAGSAGSASDAGSSAGSADGAGGAAGSAGSAGSADRNSAGSAAGIGSAAAGSGSAAPK